MPSYWGEEIDKLVDVDGTPIKRGDILQTTLGEKYPWQYFVCFGSSDYLEIRDLNANNVGMCETGLDGDVRNIGFFMLNLHVFDETDVEDYFHIDASRVNEFIEVINEMKRSK